MDEITLINLLNKICEVNATLSWQLTCKYQGESQNAIMEVGLFDPTNDNKIGFISFQMETGTIIEGRYKGMVPFERSNGLTDTLLDIYHYERSKSVNSLN